MKIDNEGYDSDILAYSLLETLNSLSIRLGVLKFIKKIFKFDIFSESTCSILSVYSDFETHEPCLVQTRDPKLYLIPIKCISSVSTLAINSFRSCVRKSETRQTRHHPHLCIRRYLFRDFRQMSEIIYFYSDQKTVLLQDCVSVAPVILQSCESSLFPSVSICFHCMIVKMFCIHFQKKKFLEEEILYLSMSVSQLYLYSFYEVKRLPFFICAGFEKLNCVRLVQSMSEQFTKLKAG